jgi:hypothetical protein
MPGEETPHQHTGSEIVPYEEDIWQELSTAEAAVYNETFQSVCEKLWSLNIQTGCSSLFSTYVGEEWVRLLAVWHNVRIGGAGGVTVPGQRLIINHEQSNNLSGERSVKVSDYLLCFQQGSMFGMHSEVFLDKESDTWNLDGQSAPFIVSKSDGVDLHVGKKYREELFPRNFLTSNDAVLANGLLRSIQVFTPASQDELADIRYQTHTDR